MDAVSHTPWDIALIDPDGFSQALHRRRPGKKLFPHIGLGYLAASLERNGDRVAILDAGISTYKELQRFLSQPYQLVGITASSFTFQQALQVAQAVKRRYPYGIVVLGGPHTSIDPQGCLPDGIDYAFCGEAEQTLVDFVEVAKRAGRPKPEVLGEVAGLIYRQNGEIKVNPVAPRLQELDQLPYPAWHLFNMKRYRQHALLTSRGCPMDCAFCAIKTIWGRQWIHRDPVQVASEIEWLVANFGNKLIHINDDNLTMNTEHVLRLCGELQQRQLRVNWVAQGMRADAATPDLVKKMRQAGCHRVSIGIESANPEVLAAIGKKETPDDMALAIRLCRQAGIQVLGMFMIGNPGDTPTTVEESIRFARAHKIDLPAFYSALPYPCTRLWTYVEQHGRWLNPDYRSFDHLSQKPVFETDDFTAEQRRLACRQAEKFCRGRWLVYHILFWWPWRLAKRNAYEIGLEVRMLLKAFLLPLRLVRVLLHGWNAGGVK